MNSAWMDGQFVLSFYQTCLLMLAWLLTTFACLGILASVVMVCHECGSFSRLGSPALVAHSEIAFKRRQEQIVMRHRPLSVWLDKMNKAWNKRYPRSERAHGSSGYTGIEFRRTS
jgi:hypothetical protein